MTDKQPESVLAAVGSRGEILKGPLVAKIAGWGGDYFAVEYSMTIHVGTQAGAERVDGQLRQEMQRFLQDLATLYEAGMRIHREYDMSDLNQLRACVVENGSLRDKAKLLRERVSRLDRMDHRTKLTMASNDAFSCVYCGGTGKDCINIPAAIKAVRDSLASGDGR
jgi:hypothetical protein